MTNANAAQTRVWAGIGPTYPWPIHSNASGNPDTGRASLMRSATPRNRAIVPSVATSGGKPPLVTSAPFRAPPAAPTASARPTAASGPSPHSCQA